MDGFGEAAREENGMVVSAEVEECGGGGAECLVIGHEEEELGLETRLIGDRRREIGGDRPREIGDRRREIGDLGVDWRDRH